MNWPGKYIIYSNVLTRSEISSGNVDSCLTYQGLRCRFRWCVPIGPMRDSRTRPQVFIYTPCENTPNNRTTILTIVVSFIRSASIGENWGFTDLWGGKFSCVAARKCRTLPFRTVSKPDIEIECDDERIVFQNVDRNTQPLFNFYGTPRGCFNNVSNCIAQNG